jgi:hypothetical protein
VAAQQTPAHVDAVLTWLTGPTVQRVALLTTSCMASGGPSLAMHEVVSPLPCGSCATSCSRRTRSCGGQRPTSPAKFSQDVYPLVHELAAENIPVAVTWRELGFPKLTFYAWCKQPVIARDWTTRT